MTEHYNLYGGFLSRRNDADSLMCRVGQVLTERINTWGITLKLNYFARAKLSELLNLLSLSGRLRVSRLKGWLNSLFLSPLKPWAVVRVLASFGHERLVLCAAEEGLFPDLSSLRLNLGFVRGSMPGTT